MPTKVIKEGCNFINPWEYFSPIAQTTSKTPAVIKYIQAMFSPPDYKIKPERYHLDISQAFVLP